MTTNFRPKTPSFTLAVMLLSLAVPCVAIAAPDLPPVPRMAAAPSSASWTIDYQYKTPNPYLKPPDPSQADAFARMRNQYARPVSIQVTKAGDHKKEVLQLDNQTQRIRWIRGDLMVLEDPQRKTFSTWDAKVPGTVPFSHDFDSLDWVDKADYEGHQTFQQVDCCAYHAKATPQGEQTAYIDAKSGLPVGVQQANLTLIYTFHSSSDPMEIPPAVEAQLKAYLDSTKGSP